MGRAKLRVSADLLRQIMCLPDDCEIVSDSYDRSIDLVVAHPSIPEGSEQVSAIFETLFNPMQSFTRFTQFVVVS